MNRQKYENGEISRQKILLIGSNQFWSEILPVFDGLLFDIFMKHFKSSKHKINLCKQNGFFPALHRLHFLNLFKNKYVLHEF